MHIYKVGITVHYMHSCLSMEIMKIEHELFYQTLFNNRQIQKIENWFFLSLKKY